MKKLPLVVAVNKAYRPKDFGKLTKRKIMDKNAKTTTVYVNLHEAESGKDFDDKRKFYKKYSKEGKKAEEVKEDPQLCSPDKGAMAPCHLNKKQVLAAMKESPFYVKMTPIEKKELMWHILEVEGRADLETWGGGTDSLKSDKKVAGGKALRVGSVIEWPDHTRSEITRFSDKAIKMRDIETRAFTFAKTEGLPNELWTLVKY